MLSPIYSTSRWSSADVAEFVDDDGGLGQRRVFQQPVEQRGLAGAEKAGEHGQRDRLRPAGRARRRRSLRGRAHWLRRCDLRLGRLGGLRCGFRLAALGFARRGLLGGVFFLRGLARRGLPTGVGIVGRAGEHHDRRLGIDRRAEHEFAGGGFRLDSMKACADAGVAARRRRRRRRSRLPRRCPPTAACAGGRRTFRRADWAAARRSAPARRRCRARASARTAPPLLKPRSSSCAAFCARTAPE